MDWKEVIFEQALGGTPPPAYRPKPHTSGGGRTNNEFNIIYGYSKERT